MYVLGRKAVMRPEVFREFKWLLLGLLPLSSVFWEGSKAAFLNYLILVKKGQETCTTHTLVLMFDKQRPHLYRESQQFFGIKIHPGPQKQLHPFSGSDTRKPLLLERLGPSRA